MFTAVTGEIRSFTWILHVNQLPIHKHGSKIRVNFPFQRGTLGFLFFIVWISVMAFAVSAKMLRAVQVFITTFFGLWGVESWAVEQSQHLWKSLCGCLLHMWICSTDVSWLPGSRPSSPGLFGSACDMVTHSSIWSSDWVTQGKLNDTEHYITCFSKPATTVKQMILRKYWSNTAFHN